MKVQLLEGSLYSYAGSKGGNLRFYQSRRSIPSIAVVPMDTEDFTQTQEAYVIRTNAPKAKKKYMEVMKSRMYGGSMEDSNFLSLYSDLSSGNINYNTVARTREYPDLFKVFGIKGRDRLYKFLTTDLKMPPSVWKEYFGDAPEVSDEHATKFHNSIVMFPDTMSKRAYTAAMATMETVFQILRKNGLGFVFGCPIRFVNIGGKVMGDYSPSADEMRVQPNIKKSEQVVFVLLHEYTHRLHRKFLNDGERQRINDVFWALRQGGHKHVDPQQENLMAVAKEMFTVGSMVRYVGRRRDLVRLGPNYRIDKVDDNGRAHLTPEKMPALRGISTSVTTLMLKTNMWQPVGQIASKMQRKGLHELDSEQWFPTPYSLTKAEEWFSEIVAFYLMGKLQGEPAKWVGNFLTGRGEIDEIVGGSAPNVGDNYEQEVGATWEQPDMPHGWHG